MEEKYDTYKRYGWQEDKEWNTYLNNIFPVPTVDKLEKIRRKWYQKNKDTEFNIDYVHKIPEKTEKEKKEQDKQRQEFHDNH